MTAGREGGSNQETGDRIWRVLQSWDRHRPAKGQSVGTKNKNIFMHKRRKERIYGERNFRK